MNIEILNNLFNTIKENKSVQEFTNELSEYLNDSISSIKWNNLISDELELYGNKIITKYKDEILKERFNILNKYAKNTKDEGEMYYIYNSIGNNEYNLCVCEIERSNEVITKNKMELPKGAVCGSILRKQNDVFVLDLNATKSINDEINNMIHEKIKEQKEFLQNSRIENHVYEVGEKYSGRIWLYDLSNTSDSGIEGIEEIEFPTELYENAQEGDKFIYKNGEYIAQELP